ncbi:hypothetical protein EVAR_44142_1 [Eumeta japonica]|uniref:Uncharacterized protein n=1 Tax=Eumeta variegata TaxID=151549 RepID=A0A4C1XPA1_EUMVA|nr:hypothetical protein EVAR_44142_1 [Eumeta japonica]
MAAMRGRMQVIAFAERPAALPARRARLTRTDRRNRRAPQLDGPRPPPNGPTKSAAPPTPATTPQRNDKSRNMSNLHTMLKLICADVHSTLYGFKNNISASSF